MAKEIQASYWTGNTLYALVMNTTGGIYNGSAFETIADANWGTYDIPMTEEGTASGIYTCTMPGVAAGLYNITVRQRVGGSPAVSDPCIGQAQIHWDGSAEISLSSVLKPTVAGRTLDVSAGGEAGVDWANVGSPTTAVGLSGTTVKAVTDAEADIAQVKADTAAILADTGTTGVLIADDAITSTKYDESTAFPLGSVDTGATQVARVGADGDTLETLSDQLDGVAVPGSAMTLADDAITLAKYDETTAFALQSVDTGATQVARTGADSDTLETLSDQIDGISLTGSYDVDLQLYKTATTTPIADVIVSVKNADQSLLLGVLTTDSLGEASMSRDAGTYKLLCQKSGFTFTSPETLTVTSGSVSQTIYGTEWTAPTAPTAYTCIVYGWVKDVDNTGLLTKTVTAKLHQTPVYYSGVGYSAIQSASDTTDANGYFELTLTRSRYMTTTTGDAGRYTLTIGEAKLIWIIEVPDASSVAFDDARV